MMINSLHVHLDLTILMTGQVLESKTFINYIVHVKVRKSRGLSWTGFEIFDVLRKYKCLIKGKRVKFVHFLFQIEQLCHPLDFWSNIASVNMKKVSYP